MASLSYREISQFLLNAGILEERINQSGRRRKYPTDQGRSIGVFTEERTGRNGNYTVILYDIKAQGFILDHMDAIIETKNNPK